MNVAFKKFFDIITGDLFKFFSNQVRFDNIVHIKASYIKLLE